MCVKDLPSAADLKDLAARLAKTLEEVKPGVELDLMSDEWRGNVRELRDVLERACMLGGAPPPTDLDFVEREHITRVLAESHGNKVVAARRLGISRRTLYRRLKHHGLLAALPGRAR